MKYLILIPDEKDYVFISQTDDGRLIKRWKEIYKTIDITYDMYNFICSTCEFPNYVMIEDTHKMIIL